MQYHGGLVVEQGEPDFQALTPKYVLTESSAINS
jgi:hypothetical protein